MSRLIKKGEPDMARIEEARDRFLTRFVHEVPATLSALFEVLPLLGPEPTDLTPPEDIEVTNPDLFSALANWAVNFGLTFDGKPARWAMNTANDALRFWQRQADRKRFVCVNWHLDYFRVGHFHEAFPAGLFELRDEWDLLNGESEPQFRKRHRENLEAYIEEMNRWTRRQQFDQPLYIDGLAMEKAGIPLATIQGSFAKMGHNIGSVADQSGVWRGLESAANFIELDRN